MNNIKEKVLPIMVDLGLILNEKNHIFLILEKRDGNWKLPGGKREKGEEHWNPRELFEELGDDVKISRIIPFTRFIMDTNNHRNVKFDVRLVKIEGEFHSIMPEGGIERMAFFPLNTSVPLSGAAKKVLEKLRQGFFHRRASLAA